MMNWGMCVGEWVCVCGCVCLCVLVGVWVCICLCTVRACGSKQGHHWRKAADERTSKCERELKPRCGGFGGGWLMC